MTDLSALAVACLRALPPEVAHQAAILALRAGLGPKARGADDPVLAVRLWGLDFPNPVGLAAGFDKNAEVMGPMLDAGFGFVEAGTVTPMPQAGNPRPRLFRLTEDGAVINRLGFNGKGLAYFAGRMARRRRPGVVGANIGKNRDTEDGAADYAVCVEALAPLVDYLTVNISSPNTPGLRSLQGRAALEDVIRRVQQARARTVPGGGPPLLIKIAPDLDAGELADVAAVALETGIDGMIVANTTTARPPTLRSPHAAEAGGLSGRPLLAPSTAVLAEMYRLTGGRVPLIGSGGVATGEDAYAKIRAGASLVQLYSAMVFRGPGIAREIADDLAGRLRTDGYASLADAVGADCRAAA